MEIEIITYKTLMDKYPLMKLDILRLREQKNKALKIIIVSSLIIGILIGYNIGKVI